MKYNPENHSVTVESGDSLEQASHRFPAGTEIPLPAGRSLVTSGNIVVGDLCFDFVECRFDVVDAFAVGDPVSDLYICVR